MPINNRPVRLYTELVRDTTSPPPKQPARGIDPVKEMEGQLQLLSTSQLRALVKRECKGANLRYGRGARERFITNLIRHRLYGKDK